VQEIQRRLGTHREVRVRVLGGATDASAWLQSHDGIEDLVVKDEHVFFSHHGDRHNEAQILRQMIEAGFEVAEFRSEERSLEDVFMHVTQGTVQ
jgi:ABC-2 type transport system ATP-binding protein